METMMYRKKYKPEFINDLKRVKDKKTKDNIIKIMDKIAHMVEFNPDHFKNLDYPLNKYKRVHVNTSYVILFTVNIKEKTVEFYRYDHHDNIYK